MVDVRGRSPGLARSTAQGKDGQLEVALLDRAGVIVSVNEAWDDFCRANAGEPKRAGVGVSYLAVCTEDPDPTAAEAAHAIRAALRGELPAPLALTSPCDAPGTPRSVHMWVSSRLDDAGCCVGATVVLSVSEQNEPTVPSQRGRGPTYQELSFPDGPRLELEETLNELATGAQEVLRTQGRLRALLHANAVVTGELSLPVVLRHAVPAARDLVGARFAALSVLGADGEVEVLVHVGDDDETTTYLGGLPAGHGVLGQIGDQAVRLEEVTRAASAAAAPGQPRRSLAIPLRVDDRLFGNVYLTDARRGGFSEEDEQLATAFVRATQVAITTAMLYEDAERRQRWQTAASELTQELFSGEGAAPLELALDFAVEAAEADFAVLSVPDGEAHLRVAAVVGDVVAGLAGRQFPVEDSVVEPVLRRGEALLLREYAALGREEGAATSDIGSVIAAPLRSEKGVVAAVSVGRRTGRRPFDSDDLDQLSGFAGHAGIAIRLERARGDREALHLLQEHERIAADLHDHVVQSLFAIGMGLQGMVHGLDRPAQQTRVLGYVDALDDTIRRIRGTIFQLDQPLHPSGTLKQRLLGVLDDEREVLGFPAEIEFGGPLDFGVPGVLADDVVAVVREALSNAARHSHARRVRIQVALAQDVVALTVTDDGTGIGDPSRSSGLTNMARRAERNGGSLEIDAPPGGGTRLRWTAHL